MSITDSSTSSANMFSRPFSEAVLPQILKWMSLGLTVLIYCLISLGGLVRNSNAGLACPDWPLCFGQVVPPMDYQIFLEWFHRLIAGSVSTLFLALSAVVFIRPELRKRFKKYCILGLCFLAGQVVLGGLTVLGLLAPHWVSSHLLMGLAFFSTVAALTLGIWDWASGRAIKSSPTHPQFLTVAWAVFFILYFQIFLGGLVSSNYAGLACPDFPTCNGMLFPPLVGLVKFQVFHRFGALVAASALLVLAVKGLRLQSNSWFSPRAKKVLFTIPLLVAVQVFLGVGSVLWKLPLLMSVAHLAVATALLGSVMVVIYEVKRS